jgi:hypothetical protein
MRALIVLLVLVVGVLHVLDGQLTTFEPPTVEPVSTVNVGLVSVAPVPTVDGRVASGNLSAVQRYQLALSVGFSPAEAVMALAVTLAENGPGNPNAVNQNTPPALPDYGLWQINGTHAAMAGGVQNLFDPVTNARVSLALSRSGSGWLQWCTVPHGCGGLPGVPNFASLLAQAQAIAMSFAAGG